MESFNMFAMLILLIAAVGAAPQFPGWDQNLASTFVRGRPIETGSTTTTPAPTASPQIQACIQSCPATSEYNPICGSDNVNYYNGGRFDCAVRCGLNIRRLHLGICTPPPTG
ncbi:uncharacterized protein LOC117570320 isoform X2 [Drosophila albomicans]|uniref:Uncharacterized protein LOC117570320 isoform X2 n=1 Tax=Drosophila albomicans TaxID=7291 RepID=A0A6P8X777_DROAB|nr:uncharacterized protein LOC117570320 isoform X2 [Drosophila albomicans]XP_051859430.1 uncharacterized protein LOC117570320 isoform X2 [Drosophila albomicans]XP_051859431.1 uncharacterized protein LOC117570320 isoform X2 [Drosophila albomicans]XP_051859432.1 uncharacterized protein LOC117570320 isoform X2 [Drosophila albomicans]